MADTENSCREVRFYVIDSMEEYLPVAADMLRIQALVVNELPLL